MRFTHEQWDDIDRLSGIGYWAMPVENPVPNVDRDPNVLFRIVEHDQYEELGSGAVAFDVTRMAIIGAWETIVNNPDSGVPTEYALQFMRAELGEDFWTDLDEDHFDTLIQIAVFGRLVYS